MTRPSQPIDLSIMAQAYGGEGIGREPAGRMVFVPYVAVGEEVQVEPIREHKRWVRAALSKVLTASPDRTTPRCPHFRQCGGCHYQHLRYEAQLQSKASILEDQLRRIGNIEEPKLGKSLPSPSPWNYRNHMQFSLTREGKLGFHRSMSQPAGSTFHHEMDPAAAEDDPAQPTRAEEQVMEIQECHLPLAALISTWESLDLDPIPGLRRVSLRTSGEGQVLIMLQADSEPDIDLSSDLPVSVVWWGPSGLKVLATDGSLQLEVGTKTFQVSAPSFFQVNDLIIESLVETVLGYLEPRDGETVFDLYAGVGLFSSYLTELGMRVIAVEQSPWACIDFEQNLFQSAEVELWRYDVAEALAIIDDLPQAMIVDPPRAGLAPEVIDGIARNRPQRLIYVSCDPATLARDAKRLVAAGFSLVEATPVDMFPQTYHIETVAKFIS